MDKLDCKLGELGCKFDELDKLDCKLDKLGCKFDELDKLRISSMSWISWTVRSMSWLS